MSLFFFCIDARTQGDDMPCSQLELTQSDEVAWAPHAPRADEENDAAQRPPPPLLPPLPPQQHRLMAAGASAGAFDRDRKSLVAPPPFAAPAAKDANQQAPRPQFAVPRPRVALASLPALPQPHSVPPPNSSSRLPPTSEKGLPFSVPHGSAQQQFQSERVAQSTPVGRPASDGLHAGASNRSSFSPTIGVAGASAAQRSPPAESMAQASLRSPASAAYFSSSSSSSAFPPASSAPESAASKRKLDTPPLADSDQYFKKCDFVQNFILFLDSRTNPSLPACF
jgi:hypothetical protein